MLFLEKADECRNPFSRTLVCFAHQQGVELEVSCGIPGARHVLGGSLGYDAALRGCYDIDLRLLVPDAGKSLDEVRRQIDAVKDLLVKRAKDDSSFESWFIDEGTGSYIWHTKKNVRVPGVTGNPDVELSWNIQAESSYHGLAEMAARLPRNVIDRYVVAKWNAKLAGDKAYRNLKGDWKALLSSLIENGGREMSDEELKSLLTSKSTDFPIFFL